jgi:polysaccharide export outer membrane protein
MIFRLRQPVAHCMLAAMLLLAATGCGTGGFSNGTAKNPVLPNAGDAAALRPGDNLVIVLQGIPDPSSNQVQIDDKGLISLPFIGAQKAAGETTALFAQQIRDTYIAKKIYTQVDVSVTVTERYVYVGGEVVRPGRVVWAPDLTISKAVQAAGGFAIYARSGQVTLVRDGVPYLIDVALAQKKPAEDTRLLPGDSLNVPKTPF